MGEVTIGPAGKPALDHVRCVGWLQMIQSAAFTLIAAILIAGLLDGDPAIGSLRSLILLVMPAVYGSLALATFAIGRALLVRRRWARIPAIAWACLMLPWFMDGHSIVTLMGVYELWVLLSNERTKSLRSTG